MASAWGESWASAWSSAWGSVGADNSFATPIVLNANATPEQSEYQICDRSGWRVKNNKGLVIEWTGNMVMEDWAEPRHDLDFVRGFPPDDRGGSPADEHDDVFVSRTEIQDSDLPGG